MKTVMIWMSVTSAMWAQTAAPVPPAAPAPAAAARPRLAQTPQRAQVTVRQPSPAPYVFAPGQAVRLAPGSVRTSGGLSTGLADRWWKNQSTAQYVGLTADQQKKMDEVFQQYRVKLVDVNAALQKEEIELEPLVAAETLDDAKITAQLDRVAQARAELEKANGRMLLAIRKQLTQEQWTKLDQIASGQRRP